MKSPKFLLIDANSVGFAAFAARQLSAGNVETQGVFGSINMVRVFLQLYPTAKPIAFWDGRSWRKDRSVLYKANRDDNKQIAEMRARYKAQTPLIKEAFRLLGVTQISASNMEADDMIAKTSITLSQKFPCLIVSGDRDLIQLVGPNVAWEDCARRREMVTSHTFAEATGYETPTAYVQGKALMGDASDNLKGVDGIGEKAAPLILAEFGSVPTAVKMIRAGGEAVIPPSLSRWRKHLMALAEPNSSGYATFIENVRLMMLDPKFMPTPEGLSTSVNKFDAEGFTKFCEELTFLSILKKFDEWVEPYARHGN